MRTDGRKYAKKALYPVYNGTPFWARYWKRVRTKARRNLSRLIERAGLRGKE